MPPIFTNPTTLRLRAGWRILLFLILFLSISITAQLILKAALGGIPRDPFLRTFAIVALAALAATIAVPIARRFLDRRSFVSLGLRIDRRAWADMAFGLLLSAAMAGSIFAVMAASGLIEVTGVDWSAAALASLAPLLLLDVIVGWWEELVFRGYLLQNMTEGMGLRWAVGVSCVLYGLVHAFNPGAGVLSTAIIVLFGFLRIYGYLATRMLWLSIGMHIGWNFFQGPIFGYAASGNRAASLVTQAPNGPAWLTGGEFGPEGSVLTVPVVGLALLVMSWWSRGRTPWADPT